ncbi:hypothetical protein SteCoe_9400 [Stentor coeruleus]|uniref:RING-type domain-containing protein n=1 Tax=Stentor coeruleus TaxID=5963 RepID=A0A1R2CI37_9CILI|nr:hypothetical protein SteCoe_9400 [Stentor coeruleus]
MNRSNTSSNSPKLAFSSPRNIIDGPISGQKRLPLIKDRASVCSGQRFFVQTQEARRETIPSSKSQKTLEMLQQSDDHKSVILKTLPPKKTHCSPEQRKSRDSDKFDPHKCNLEIDSHKIPPKDKSQIDHKEGISIELHCPSLSKSNSIENTLELSAPIHKTASESNLTLLEPPSPENLNEVINNLKHELEMTQRQNRLQIKHQLENREIYEKEIDKLIKENNELEVLLNKSYEKIEKLKAEIKKQNLEVGEIRHKNREIILSTDNDILYLKEEIESKDREILELSEQYKISEATKKRYGESAKEIEAEFETFRKSYEVMKKEYDELKKKYTQLKDDYRDGERKLKEKDQIIDEVVLIKNENAQLKSQFEEVVSKLKVCEESLNTVTHNYNNSRVSWKDREVHLENTIISLREQINTEKDKKTVQVAETVKLKKALTLKDSDSIVNFSKDEVFRYYQKCIKQEKESMELHTSIDKLKKDVEYLKNQLKGKENIISRMSTHVTGIEMFETKATHCKGMINKICSRIKKRACCKNCMEGQKTYLSIPCNHIICEDCKNEIKKCKVCGADAIEMIAFKYFDLIRESITTLESMIE